MGNASYGHSSVIGAWASIWSYAGLACFLVSSIVAIIQVGGCVMEEGAVNTHHFDAAVETPYELCAGHVCFENESCGLVNFQESCVCGDEPHCGDGGPCYLYQSGRLSCTPPIPSGSSGCNDGVHECGNGDYCMWHGAREEYICTPLCMSNAVFCDEAEYCIPFADYPYAAPYDGFCNVGGTTGLGGKCEWATDCIPGAYCVGTPDGGAECFLPCRPYKDDCPGVQDCVPLIGKTTLGVCL